jgi:hypothetical protein
MVISTGQQSLPRRSAQRRGVKPVAAQPTGREAIGSRHVDRSTERRRRAEADVVSVGAGGSGIGNMELEW